MYDNEDVDMSRREADELKALVADLVEKINALREGSAEHRMIKRQLILTGSAR